MKQTDPFYLGTRWKKKRGHIMRRDKYMCQYFKRYGRFVPAVLVHHIFPREIFPQYELADWNLIALSLEAHNKMHDRNTDDLTAEGIELLRRTARQQGIEVPKEI